MQDCGEGELDLEVPSKCTKVEMQVAEREIHTGCKEKSHSDGDKNIEPGPNGHPHPQRY